MVWHKPFTNVFLAFDFLQVLDSSRAPLYRWFPDGHINMCYNAVDRHVDNGDGDNTAIIYDSVYTKAQEKITYKQVQEQVGRIASILQKQFGVEKGDRVLLYMPMIPISVYFMLACARIGAIHSVVFGGFAAPELANRIDDCTPKVIITASCGLEPGKVIRYRPIVDEALSLCSKVENALKTVRRIIVQRSEHEDKEQDKEMYFDFKTLLDNEKDIAPCVPVESTHPLYILCKVQSLNYFRHFWDNRCSKGYCKRHRRHCCGS